MLLVVSQALTRGTFKSIWSNGGILAANALYFILSATGLGAVLMASYDLFFAIKWIGAVYLVFLGISALLEKQSMLTVPTPDTEQKGPKLFPNGFLLQAANPKSLRFFSAILRSSSTPENPLPCR